MMVTKSPTIALPSLPMSRLNPKGRSSPAAALTATSAKSRSSSATKKRSGSSPNARTRHRLGVPGGRRRGPPRPPGGVVAPRRVDRGGDGAGLVGSGDPAGPAQGGDLGPPLPGAFRRAGGRGSLLSGLPVRADVHD